MEAIRRGSETLAEEPSRSAGWRRVVACDTEPGAGGSLLLPVGIARSRSGSDALLAGIEGVAQAVADEVDVQHDDQDHDAGDVEQPRSGLCRLLAVGDDQTKG
jgi:hypothetical protein